MNNMNALRGKELEVFLALCKAVRWQQEILCDEGKNVSAAYIRVYYTHQLERYLDDMDAKQVYAIMHRLREKGFVKMEKVPTRTIYAKRQTTTVFSITPKGMEYIKQLKCMGVNHMGKLHIVHGDLLASDCTVIAHQANCMGVMDAGIAKQIKERYPEAYQADLNFEVPVGSPRRLGRCSRTYVDNKRRVVINLYGQFRYGRSGRYTYYDALRSALEEALYGLRVLEAKGFPVKFGVPYGMGAGLAGGDWNVIYAMLEHLAAEFQRDIYVYKLS